jgi:hypothetical protein
MKNKFFALMAVALFIGFLANIILILAASNSCTPEIKLINQDPDPAIPSSYVKLLFQVSGLENPACSEGIAVKMVQNYPFSLDSANNSIQTLEGSTYSKGYKTTWNVPYNMRIADDALDGSYELELLLHVGGGTNFESFATGKTFNISVSDSRTDFDIVVQEVSGTQASLGIVNTGKNSANSLVVSIPQQENFRITGTNEQIVGNLAAGDYTIVSFNIAPKNQRNMTRINGREQPDNSAENQLLKIQIEYTDEIGKRRVAEKELELSSSVFQGNVTANSGFNGQTNFYSRRNNVGISIWWYVLGIVILVVAVLIIVYKKYEHKIKDFYKKRHHEKVSGNTPNWVLTERTHNKNK